MWDEVTTGFFVLAAAVISGWLVEGGVRRRARKTIREELELANLVPEDQAKELRESARRRTTRYLNPLHVRLGRASLPERGAYFTAFLAMVSGGAVLLTALLEADPSPGPTTEPPTWAQALILIVAAGAAVGAAIAILNVGLVPMIDLFARRVTRFVEKFGYLLGEFAARLDRTFSGLGRRVLFGRKRR